jgi:hypothetical protein
MINNGKILVESSDKVDAKNKNNEKVVKLFVNKKLSEEPEEIDSGLKQKLVNCKKHF